MVNAILVAHELALCSINSLMITSFCLPLVFHEIRPNCPERAFPFANMVLSHGHHLNRQNTHVLICGAKHAVRLA